MVVHSIHTLRLYLRPFHNDDIEDLFAFHSLADVTQFLYWSARDRAETQQVLERKKTEIYVQVGAKIVLAVVHQESSKVIGEVSLFWHSQEHAQGEIGFVFHPAYQGFGYTTEAAAALLAWGFTELQLHRIYGRCDARNVASYQLMERLGMRREAHFLHNEKFKGEWGDELVYALLVDEWNDQKNKQR